MRNGIWHFFYTADSETKTSAAAYNFIHQDYFGGPKDGSYEILAAFARGNRTLDIACGEGIIELLAPNTVGVDFSENALLKAKKAGVRYLVRADAHALPFKENSFDMSICAGSFEHFTNPLQALKEMGRVSKIQIITVHRYPDIPFAEFLFRWVTFFLHLKHQPIENPVNIRRFKKLFKDAGLKIIFEGNWTLPINYGRVLNYLPEFTSIPSCAFIISLKK